MNDRNVITIEQSSVSIVTARIYQTTASGMVSYRVDRLVMMGHCAKLGTGYWVGTTRLLCVKKCGGVCSKSLPSPIVKIFGKKSAKYHQSYERMTSGMFFTHIPTTTLCLKKRPNFETV